MKLFEQTYCGESIVDLDRDMSEMLDGRYNAAAATIPVDEYNIQQGTFKVTVEWIPPEDSTDYAEYPEKELMGKVVTIKKYIEDELGGLSTVRGYDPKNKKWWVVFNCKGIIEKRTGWYTKDELIIEVQDGI